MTLLWTVCLSISVDCVVLILHFARHRQCSVMAINNCKILFSGEKGEEEQSLPQREFLIHPEAKMLQLFLLQVSVDHYKRERCYLDDCTQRTVCYGNNGLLSTCSIIPAKFQHYLVDNYFPTCSITLSSLWIAKSMLHQQTQDFPAIPLLFAS